MDLKELRKSKGIIRAWLAKKVGITSNYLYELESGRKRITAKMQAKLAGGLNENQEKIEL